MLKLLGNFWARLLRSSRTSQSDFKSHSKSQMHPAPTANKITLCKIGCSEDFQHGSRHQLREADLLPGPEIGGQSLRSYVNRGEGFRISEA